MIISDLSHLEEVSEAPSIVGGALQQNFSSIFQKAQATATAYSVGGPALAIASSSNYANVGQTNSLYPAQ
jgi:hypothetical protein